MESGVKWNTKKSYRYRKWKNKPARRFTHNTD